MTIDFMNRWITPENVMWLAAFVSLVLLVFVGPVSEIFLSRKNHGTMRLLKIALFFTLPLLVFFPALVLLMGETVRGTPCGFYLLFFSLFCYYLGKKTGFSIGRSNMSDLIGLEMFDSVEDAQDRLYESRQRLSSREEVIKSIAGLAKKKPVPGFRPEEVDDDESGIPPQHRRGRKSEVLDVVVEVDDND